jgi:hypothetical protein
MADEKTLCERCRLSVDFFLSGRMLFISTYMAHQTLAHWQHLERHMLDGITNGSLCVGRRRSTRLGFQISLFLAQMGVPFLAQMGFLFCSDGYVAS